RASWSILPAWFPRPADGLPGGPGLDTQPPQSHKALGVVVAEAVGRLVGGQVVVVQADLAAPAGHDAATGELTAQADLPGHEPLALLDEGVQRLLERREPQPVVDQVGIPGLEPGLLVAQVTLEGQVLEIGVGHEQGQGAGALVYLPALEPHPAVLDHVDAAPPVGAAHPGDLTDQ